MVEKKGIAYGLRAMAEAVGQGLPLVYDIVGDGPLRDDLEQLAKELGIAARVHFHGWQEQTAVAALMDDCDILLAPSVTSVEGDQEGIPVTLMEGMAAGMLVISTYHSGIPELVEPGRSGLLVPERDMPALAAALMSLAKRPEVWSGMSHAARRRVEAAFEVTALNARLAERFATLLAGAPPSRQPVSERPAGRERPAEAVVLSAHSRIDHR
jgi:colanic acid/amylovoran biosynthesis glycosyltransferase